MRDSTRETISLQRNVDLPPVNKVVSPSPAQSVSTQADVESLFQLKMMLDIAQGLTYLHDRNPRVIHRDVS
jgi:hypothetical protein